jgi:hypothetical protein
MCDEKPTHVKPNFYTYCFEELKIIARRYGYNLVIHGSMNRDLDLIAIPWSEKLGVVESMIMEFSEYLGASIMPLTEKQKYCFPHGRYSYILEMCRRKFDNGVGVFGDDREYYLDISIIPVGAK